MSSSPKANSARQAIIHRRLSEHFDTHSETLEMHRARGGPWAEAVEKLEGALGRGAVTS